jgi:acyl-CoA thioesterase I
MDKVICIFGDSITMGAWDLEKGGWANRLRLFIDTEQRSGRIKDYFTIYNLGVDGDTTAGLLQRFQAEAEFRNPSIIIFAIGSNDSVFAKSKNEFLVPLDEFEKNIKELIDEAKNISQTVIFLSAGKVDEKKTTPLAWVSNFYQENKNILLYNQKIKEAAEKNKIFYLDIFDSLSEKYLEDGIHPNAAGHEKMFVKIKDFLLKNKIV